MSGWIPCAERMPPMEERVLIWCSTVARIARRIGTGWMVEVAGLDLAGGSTPIEHWQPLPEPPA